MDNQLKDMLMKLLEGQNRLETKVTGLETKITGLETKVSGLDTKITGLDTKVTGLETEVKNGSVKLENIEKKIDIIAEVQTAHKEQNQQGFGKLLQVQGNKNTLVETSLKTVSDDVVEVKKGIKELKEKFDKVEKVTMQNTYDVAYLKSVK